jgi:hypothetical protein
MLSNTIRNCIFAYKCNANWSELIETKSASIKFCSSCQRKVHLCEDDYELVEAIKLNRCVSIPDPDGIGRLMGDVIRI